MSHLARRLVATAAVSLLALGGTAGGAVAANDGGHREKERVAAVQTREKEGAVAREKERTAGREKERTAGREKERTAAAQGREKERTAGREKERTAAAQGREKE